MERRPGARTLSEDDRRVLAVWAADCAERTLPLFEARAPADARPREAIDGLRAFARGELRIGPVRALAARAHAGHAYGASAYAAKAVGLAAPNDPVAVAAEVRWQRRHATAPVRAALLRLPLPDRPAGVLGALIYELHSALAMGG